MNRSNDPKPAAADSPEQLLGYQMVTRYPTRVGNVRVVVDRSGGVRLQKNEAEPATGQEWTAPFPAEPQATLRDPEARLFKVLERGGFFSMEPLQVNEAATDGTRQTLTWNGRSGPRTVTIDRARSPKFDALKGELFRALRLVGLA
jgi:hypothetical protein